MLPRPHGPFYAAPAASFSLKPASRAPRDNAVAAAAAAAAAASDAAAGGLRPIMMAESVEWHTPRRLLVGSDSPAPHPLSSCRSGSLGAAYPSFPPACKAPLSGSPRGHRSPQASCERPPPLPVWTLGK